MDMSQSRKPDRPKEAIAAKGGGKQSKTPSMDMGGSHVPARGESVAATHGKHVDGLGTMAAQSMGILHEAMTPSQFVRRSSKNAGSYVNKSA